MCHTQEMLMVSVFLPPLQIWIPVGEPSEHLEDPHALLHGRLDHLRQLDDQLAEHEVRIHLRQL